MQIVNILQIFHQRTATQEEISEYPGYSDKIEQKPGEYTRRKILTVIQNGKGKNYANCRL